MERKGLSAFWHSAFFFLTHFQTQCRFPFHNIQSHHSSSINRHCHSHSIRPRPVYLLLPLTIRSSTLINSFIHDASSTITRSFKSPNPSCNAMQCNSAQFSSPTSFPPGCFKTEFTLFNFKERDLHMCHYSEQWLTSLLWFSPTRLGLDCRCERDGHFLHASFCSGTILFNFAFDQVFFFSVLRICYTSLFFGLGFCFILSLLARQFSYFISRFFSLSFFRWVMIEWSLKDQASRTSSDSGITILKISSFM